MDNVLQFDALIIGSGLAGLSLALKLADQQKVVFNMSKCQHLELKLDAWSLDRKR